MEDASAYRWMLKFIAPCAATHIVRSRTVTQLLNAAQSGDRSAMDRLFPLVYDELHHHAGRQRAVAGGLATMNTTAIVHEAYLKLADQKGARFENRAHFFAVAAKAMQHVFLDYTKRKSRQKRGGNVAHVDIDDVPVAASTIEMGHDEADRILALDEALDELAKENSRLAQVVECRFFGGMTVEDTANALGTSPATVKRDWNTARALLFRTMKSADGE